MSRAKKITRNDRDTWVLLENLKAVLKSLDSKAGCLIHFDKDGTPHFIWTYHDVAAKHRMEKYIEIIQSNSI